MDIAEFKYKRDHFPYEACALSWNEKVWMREEFVKQFSREKIANMTIEEYVVGSGDKSTFCYGIGHGLNQLAHVGNLFPTTFGVYYNKEKKTYVTDTKRWNNPEKAFADMKAYILDLLDAGEKEDLEALAKNPIQSTIKGKILCTYFPKRYLSICGTTHLDYYMKAYGIYDKSKKNLNPVYKRESLVAFKNDDPIMRNWTLDQFAYFMWGVYPQSPKRNSVK